MRWRRGILRARPIGFERALHPKSRLRWPAPTSGRQWAQGAGRDRPPGRARRQWWPADELARRLIVSASPQALPPPGGNPAAYADYFRFRWPSPNPPTRSLRLLRSDAAALIILMANVPHNGHAANDFDGPTVRSMPCTSTEPLAVR
jgi:hypothetical protein